jgi:hypothetical protein
MLSSPINTNKLEYEQLQPVIQCPTKNRNTVSVDTIEYTIPNGQVIWWHCSLCQGWHVIIDDCPQHPGQVKIFGKN